VSTIEPADEPTEGDRSAVELEAEFAAFFAAHHDAVLRSLTSAVGNDDEAAVDATQDAFIKAHARWSTIRTYDKPEAWLRRIAINTSRDRRRSDRQRRGREVAAEAATDSAAYDLDVEHLGADEAVREILSQLPPGQRTVATMYYIDDRSTDDIATALDISAGTVKSQLAEARARLRRSDLS
jgi:RNA polymerase sigma-70 factor (ECF subfamily)